MATKIKLGSTPKTFKKVITFPMLDGTVGSIECIYKYRTKTAFGLFIDGLMDAAKLKAKPEDGEFSMGDLMERTAGSNAEYLLQVLEGWNLDEELSLTTAQQLADEVPGAAKQIMEVYAAAVSEGRLGN